MLQGGVVGVRGGLVHPVAEGRKQVETGGMSYIYYYYKKGLKSDK